MSQPDSNDPLLSAIPELGDLVQPQAANIAPRDAEKEALQASMKVPEWIKPQLDLGKVPGAAPAPQQAQAAPTLPGTPEQMQQMLALFQQMAAGVTAPQAAAPAPQPFQQSAVVPPPTPGVAPQTVAVPQEPLQHPVITDLLRDFGITTDKVVDHEFKGHTYRIREASADLTNYVLGAASRLAITDADYVSRTRFMTAALSVISIDGASVLDLFKWDSRNLRRGETMDKAFPPVSAIVSIAPELFRFFLETLKIDVIDSIASKYDSVFGETEDEASTKTPLGMLMNDTRVRFKCTAAGCGHVEDIVPEYVDEAKTSVRVRFCSRDGAPMTPIGRLKDLGDIPLA